MLRTEHNDAMWITSWPFAEYVKHAWGGAWICSCFRNESKILSSDLIRDAVAATRAFFGAPPEPHGFISFVDPSKTRRKRDPGRCYLRAGWEYPKCDACASLPKEQRRECEVCHGTECAHTKGGLRVLQLRPDQIGASRAALGITPSIFDLPLSP